MLKLGGKDGVENPIEAEDRVEDHGEVIDPGAFVSENFAEKGMLGIGVAKT